jgi:type IV pilus assembly protein PilM
MFSPQKSKATVGLDVDAGSVAASEVERNGRTQVAKFGVVPLGSGVFREGEVSDPEALGEALKQLWAEHKLAKDVRLGIANQRVAVRTLRLPHIEDKQELETAIRFQAQDTIPMPLEQAVMDWQVVGRSTGEDGAQHVDVVTVAARRDMLGSLMEAMGYANLKPSGIDLSAFGMVRALAREAHPGIGTGNFVSAPNQGAVPSYEDRIALAEAEAGGEGAVPQPPQVEPAKLYCNLGDVTNLAVARGSTCLFTRVSSFGVEGIAQKLAERRQLTLEHARQWLVHVGLEAATETIDGDPETVGATRETLVEGAAKLVDELRLSLEFYAAQEGSTPVEGVVVCGPGTTIAGLPERLQRDLGQRFEVGRPSALGHLDDREAARLTLSYGLALEN